MSRRTMAIRTSASRSEASDMSAVTRPYSASSRGSGCLPPNLARVTPTADSASWATTCWYLPGTLSSASSRSSSDAVATSLDTSSSARCAWSVHDEWSGAGGAQPADSSTARPAPTTERANCAARGVITTLDQYPPDGDQHTVPSSPTSPANARAACLSLRACRGAPGLPDLGRRRGPLPAAAGDQGLVDRHVAATHLLRRESLGVAAALVRVDLTDPLRG